MSRHTIGGVLDWAALYGHARHRPTDAPTIRAAAIELAQRGLTPRDIAQALDISETAARQLLAWVAA